MPSIITFLLLLLSFLTFSTSSLIDTDGDPIQNGKTYYILTPKGGIAYYTTSTGPRCPLAITYEKKGKSYRRTPVRISSPLRILNIALEERVTLAFDTDVCDEEEKSLVWKVKSYVPSSGRKSYIITGGDEGARSFSINSSSFTRYELKYWVSSDEGVTSSNVGFYSLFLGLTEISTPVWFEKAFEKKAFDNVLELPSTSILS